MLSEDQALWFTISLFVIAAMYWFSQGWLVFIQMAIIVSVVCAAIYWEWPGSGYSHVFVGIVLAFLVTVLPLVLYDMGVQLKSWLLAWRRDWRSGALWRRPRGLIRGPRPRDRLVK